jgi:hypothetical protein
MRSNEFWRRAMNHRAKAQLVLAAVACALGVGLYWVTSSYRPRDIPSETTEASIQVGADLQPPPAPPEPAPVTENFADPVSEPSDANSISDEEDKFTGDPPATWAEDLISSEPVDVSWAPGIEAQFYEEINEDARMSFTTMDVQCRTTICRVELTFDMNSVRGRTEPYYRDIAAGFRSVIENDIRLNAISGHPLGYAFEGPVGTARYYVFHQPSGIAPWIQELRRRSGFVDSDRSLALVPTVGDEVETE